MYVCFEIQKELRKVFFRSLWDVKSLDKGFNYSYLIFFPAGWHFPFQQIQMRKLFSGQRNSLVMQ